MVEPNQVLNIQKLIHVESEGGEKYLPKITSGAL